MNNKIKQISAIIITFFVTLIAYWNLQYNQLINYDDVKYLIENENVRAGLTLASVSSAFTTFYDANWFPLTWISHSLDVTLFGMDPKGHHFVNLLIHCSNSLLLFTLLRRLTGAFAQSLITALIFSLHPMHVESVAWAAERKDLLSTLFFMFGGISYIEYCDSRSLKNYFLTLAAFVFGLMSKPMLVTFPLLLILFDYWKLRLSSNKLSSLIIEKIPFIFFSIISSIITFIAQKNGGAVSETILSSAGETVVHVIHNYAHYIIKLLIPIDLVAIYPYEYDLPLFEVCLAFIMLALISFAAIKYSKSLPFFLFGWLWFLIALLPVIGIVSIGAHSIADRYTYIPSIGFIIALVWLSFEYVQTERLRTVLIVAYFVVITAYSVLTWRQVEYWKDGITLFEHTLKHTKNNWIAHANLASELLKYNRYNEAIFHLQESIRINSENGVAYYNLAMALNMIGDRKRAIDAIDRAIFLKPSFAEAYYYSAIFHSMYGDMREAYIRLEQLKTLNTELAFALQNSMAAMNNGK